MASDTCGRCHRPFAALDSDYLTDPALCGRSLLGTPLDPGLPDDIAAECAAARDRWQVAEIARLTAELAEARKPRWVSDFVRGEAICETGGRVFREHDGTWSWFAPPKIKTISLGYATEDEAKKAAEEACGGEAQHGDV